MLKSQKYLKKHPIYYQNLCHIINRIFISSTVLQEFKKAVVAPVHKKNVNKHRPISVITSLAKIFEEVLNIEW